MYRVTIAGLALLTTMVACSTTTGGTHSAGDPSVAATSVMATTPADTDTTSEEPLIHATAPYVGDTETPDVVELTPAEETPTVETPADDAVVYTVSGHEAGTITYMTATGDIAQVTDTTRLPWTKQFTLPAGTEGFLSVSAQNAGSGDISCAISVNGQQVDSNTSTGEYAIADCSSH